MWGKAKFSIVFEDFHRSHDRSCDRCVIKPLCPGSWGSLPIFPCHRSLLLNRWVSIHFPRSAQSQVVSMSPFIELEGEANFRIMPLRLGWWTRVHRSFWSFRTVRTACRVMFSLSSMNFAFAVGAWCCCHFFEDSHSGYACFDLLS